MPARMLARVSHADAVLCYWHVLPCGPCLYSYRPLCASADSKRWTLSRETTKTRGKGMRTKRWTNFCTKPMLVSWAQVVSVRSFPRVPPRQRTHGPEKARQQRVHATPASPAPRRHARAVLGCKALGGEDEDACCVCLCSACAVLSMPRPLASLAIDHAVWRRCCGEKTAAKAHQAAAEAQQGADGHGQQSSAPAPAQDARPSETQGRSHAAVFRVGGGGQEEPLTHEQAMAAYFAYFGSEGEGKCTDDTAPATAPP